MRFMNFGAAIAAMKSAFAGSASAQDAKASLADIRVIDTFRQAPFGTSRMTTACDASSAKKNKAKRRARRLGHA